MATADATVTFGAAGGWDGGYSGSIVIRNDGTAPIADWRVEWDGGPSVGSLWNGTYTLTGNHAVLVNAGWNGTIAPGASVSIGFTGVGALTENVSNCTVNGAPATVAYSGAGGGGDDGGDGNDHGDGDGDNGDNGNGGDAPGSGASSGPFACVGDLDGDGAVDGADLGVLLGQWGGPASSAADLNGDRAVDGVDLGALLGAWGECPPQKVIVGYWIEWGIYGRNYQPADTPFDKVTHLNYAFADISTVGRVVPYDKYAALE
jgi:chitinase